MAYPSGPPQPGAPSARRRPVALLVLVGVVVLALVAAAGVGGVLFIREQSSSGSAQGSGAGRPMPRTAPALAKFYDQSLHWSSCGANKCSRLTVPLDYAHPGGATISLGVVEVPATGNAIGSLVVNPGGPGGSGVDYAKGGTAYWPARLTSSYNLVGFDPRGVGESDPLRCLGTAQMDRFVQADPDPSTAAGRAELMRETRQFGQACLRHSGALVRHMSTDEVARDMDILRQALGEPRLDYFGASYGTFLGSAYANLFPHNVGRMVLDGAVDPAQSNLQLSLGQAHGFEIALRAYVANCIAKGGCFLGSTVEQGTQRIKAAVDALEAHPLHLANGRTLTAGNGVLGVFMPLYVRSYWPYLTQALQALIQGHDGGPLLYLSDAYSERTNRGYSSLLAVNYAVNCLDHDDYVPVSKVPSYFPRFEKAAPTFGKIFAFGLASCSVWPVKTHHVSHAVHAQGAPPIVVLGTTRDPATPLADAIGLARELASGVLITRNGDGHTAFNKGNPCVDNAVEDYLVDGTVPKNGLHC